MRTNLIRTTGAVLILLLAGIAGAQEPDLITDRPDFTESGVVVPPGSVQFEGGFTWEDAGDDLSVLSGPELLMRWGVFETVELRIGAPGYTKLSNGVDISGLSDASLGAKMQFGPREDWDLAAIVTTTVPTGEDEFTSDAWDPSLIVAAGRDLDETWSLGCQGSFESASVGDEREMNWGATVVVGRGLDAEGRVGGFLELAAVWPEEGDAPIVLHHGYTYLVHDTFQLDVHGGLGLSDTAPDQFFGAGLSFRF